ncbi:MAG: glycosyltransferase [Oscillospiraceae bacterium]|nr:glycosyltransferase [Oscillospiraceae bacterium]
MAILRKHFSWKCIFTEMKWVLKNSLKAFPKKWSRQQRLWECWKRTIPAYAEHYDVAVSYLEGYSSYYVMEKVSANKKVLWVHSEYQKLRYDPFYDKPYYEKADGIITISEKCKQCILQEFPQCREKVFVLPNITIPHDVLRNSTQGECREFTQEHSLKLLTVARLHPLKGVDIAIEAAKELKKEGIGFCWLVVGDGPERGKLQQQITDQKLNDCFFLLGSRENPYVYMKNCDILVQPSRVEGKSIVLDEAKILCKPIVATNYTTVEDSVVHGETGWIVDMTPKAVAQGILHLWRKASLREQMSNNLMALPKSDETLLQQYINVMFE